MPPNLNPYKNHTEYQNLTKTTPDQCKEKPYQTISKSFQISNRFATEKERKKKKKKSTNRR